MNMQHARCNTPPATREDRTLPLVEEHVVVGTREVVGDKLTVQTRLISDTHDIEAELHREHVSVKRVPHNTVLETAPTTRTEDGTTIIPIVREELFLQKRLILVEEVHITKTVSTQTVSTEAELRRLVPKILRDAD